MSLFFDPDIPVDIHNRYLPHWQQDCKIYFVTFRLYDSLPQDKLEQLRQQKQKWLMVHPQPLNESEQREYHRLFSQKIDKWLDAGYGACIMNNPDISKIVEDALLNYDGKRHILHAYVVMGNHVHLIIQPFENIDLSDIMHSIKSYSSKQINKRLNRKGHVWMKESYDRIVRDQSHYDNLIKYIHKNISQGGQRWLLQVTHASSVDN